MRQYWNGLLSRVLEAVRRVGIEVVVMPLGPTDGSAENIDSNEARKQRSMKKKGGGVKVYALGLHWHCIGVALHGMTLLG
jgi:hypothetical protein